VRASIVAPFLLRRPIAPRPVVASPVVGVPVVVQPSAHDVDPLESAVVAVGSVIESPCELDSGVPLSDDGSDPEDTSSLGHPPSKGTIAIQVRLRFMPPASHGRHPFGWRRHRAALAATATRDRTQ